MKVIKLDSDQWSGIAEEAHLICFNEKRPASMERLDFALLATDDSKPVAYMTCRELDSETVYLQHGGSFPGSQGTTASFKAYVEMLRELKQEHKRAGTYIENTNTTMLKMAMKVGWLITGLRTFEGSILLEHQINFTDMEV